MESASEKVSAEGESTVSEVAAAPEKEEEEEKPKEEEKKDAASLATVEKKARFNPLAAVYSNIDSEEPPPFEFLSNLPEMYSLDLDIIRLTAQYTAVNGRKVRSTLIHYT